PLVMLEKAANSRQFVDSFFLKNGINLDPEIELGAHHLLIEFAKINLGISCVIKEFSNLDKNKSIFEIKLKNPLPKRYIGICTLASISPSQAASIFTKWCYSVFLDS
ncbi:MAG: LysR family transcriptional regulator substrate-binding protein, partial [Oscillospiraceae bacterium]